MGIDAKDIQRLGKDAQAQIAAKLAVSLVESRKYMERRSKYGAEMHRNAKRLEKLFGQRQVKEFFKQYKMSRAAYREPLRYSLNDAVR